MSQSPDDDSEPGKSYIEGWAAIYELIREGRSWSGRERHNFFLNTGTSRFADISSVAGLTGTPATMAYSASKWAVRGMTKVMARELAPFGIRVNSVHPGVIDTAMIEEFRALDDDALALMTAEVPVGRVGTPEDVADVVLFLASDESSYSTGSEFVVDGGLSL